MNHAESVTDLEHELCGVEFEEVGLAALVTQLQAYEAQAKALPQ